MNINAVSEKCPLMAILRGIKSEEAERYVGKLIELGYDLIEVPLNSPNALNTIRLLQQKFGNRCCIGAGTVTDVELLQQVLAMGTKLIVTPNINPDVIKLAKQNGCIIFVGIMTPSEAFSAIHAGAKFLKIFPAELIGVTGFKAIKSVLPKDIFCFPVGGIKADTAQMQSYVSLGANGFGLGSALYSSGISFAQFIQNATEFQTAWQGVQK